MPSVLERLRTGLAPHYTVERELGSGGMGDVYLGRDQALDRPVAIKVLRPELATAITVERFVREAQYLAGLNHPNILPIHMAGQADGLVYYVMDLMEGESLNARLAKGPLSAREVAQLGKDLLCGLAAVHGKGITHRDIKPANIFLVGGRAVLGDFGIAQAGEDGSDALTAPGQVIGTLAYMAPEQLSGAPVTPRTDLYAVGLVLYEASTGKRWNPLASPEEGDWAGVPGALAGVLQKALQPAPNDRWHSAQNFARALSGRSAQVRLSRLSPLIPLAALVVFAGVWWRPESKSAASKVAIYPFEVAGLADTALGSQLARLTASYLEALPEVTVAPVRTTFRDWRVSTLPPVDRLSTLTGGPNGAAYGVWGVVRPATHGVEVQLRAVSARGEPVLESVVRGSPADRLGFGDSLALEIVRKVFPRSERLYRSAGAFAGVKPGAVSEFLFGEDAAERDAWLTAERHYLNALGIDSTFVLAAWRLANARRWMPLRSTPPLPQGFLDLYRKYGSALNRVDRLLVDAQFAPGGKERFALYEEAIRQAPRDAYAPLFYGDELFHRGPLAGRSRDEAIGMLQRAVHLDSSLAPAHEHLAWALIRSGRRDEARQTLDALKRVAGGPEESEIYLPTLLEIAFAMRFAPDSATQQPALGSPSVLGLAARGALSFDMPRVQAALGARLSSLSSVPAALHGSGEIAQGIALMAMGRATNALPHFDRASTLLAAREEARLQAAEWRVVPSALGIPGVSPSEVERGRKELGLISRDSALGTRAAWALALDALSRGNTSRARDWVRQVQTRSGATGILAIHLGAMERAGVGELGEALALSESALAYDSAGAAGDPFFRSVLHLQRGEWLAALGQARAADTAWLWYENLDAVGWPSTVAQACEVDWALGTYARWRRARLADSTGSRNAACQGMAEVAALWAEADPGYGPMLTHARGVLRRCSR
jgi:tetratricopeptide (TPR) repeat protein